MDLAPYIRMTRSNLAFLLLFACSACPVMGATFYGFFRLFFGTLYPAYASYKAVKTKNVKEYVKWMMYWIVFALFSCAETFTDVFVAWWFPFYYEIKIVLVLWLLSPATRGSSILYRKFVHPQLVKREKDIDEYLNRAREQGYHAVVQLGSKGFNYASQVLVQTALKSGGQIVTQLQRSYSLSDLEPQSASGQRALPYPSNRHPDQVDSDEAEAISALDDVLDRHSVHEISADEEGPEAPPRRHTPSPLRLGRGRSRKGDGPSSGYSSAENLSTGASLVEPSALPLSRQSLRSKGSRSSTTSTTTTQLSHISQLHTKRSLQQLEVGSSATLPRAKRATRRIKANVS